MENFQVFGLSSWADNAFYDMDAIAGAGADPKTPSVPAVLSPPMREMLQALLAERFQLELHRESRPMSVYELTVAKGGAKLTPTPDAGKDPWWRYARGEIAGRNRTIQWLAESLTRELGAVVHDSTGLKSAFDFDLKWAEDGRDPTLPSLPSALKDLGIALDHHTGPVPVLIVDSASRPTEN